MRFHRPAFVALFALVACCAVVTPATAAPPTAESVDTLMTLTKMQRLLDSAFANIDQLMRQSTRTALQGEPMTPEQQRVIDGMQQRFAVIFREEMSWAKLQPIYVRIYQESFTQEEVDGLIAFYRTPTGNALIEKMPVVMQKSVAEMQTMMGPMLARMKAAADEAVAEAKKAKS